MHVHVCVCVCVVRVCVCYCGMCVRVFVCMCTMWVLTRSIACMHLCVQAWQNGQTRCYDHTQGSSFKTQITQACLTPSGQLVGVGGEGCAAHDVVMLPLVQLVSGACIPQARTEVCTAGGAQQSCFVEHAGPHGTLHICWNKAVGQ